MTGAVAASLSICAAAAVLEGVLAGRGTRKRLGELRLPRYSPPFVLWVAIGLAYYVICFVVLHRLLTGIRVSASGWAALVLLGILMGLNTFWNFLFFRRKDLRAGSVVMRVYVVVAIALAGFLFRVDVRAAWAFLPYVLYLGYALWWTRGVCRLNP